MRIGAIGSAADLGFSCVIGCGGASLTIREPSGSSSSRPMWRNRHDPRYACSLRGAFTGACETIGPLLPCRRARRACWSR
jgi:hypothetical protein